MRVGRHRVLDHRLADGPGHFPRDGCASRNVTPTDPGHRRGHSFRLVRFCGMAKGGISLRLPGRGVELAGAGVVMVQLAHLAGGQMNLAAGSLIGEVLINARVVPLQPASGAFSVLLEGGGCRVVGDGVSDDGLVRHDRHPILVPRHAC